MSRVRSHPVLLQEQTMPAVAMRVLQTQCRGVKAGGSWEPALSPGLWLAWGQALRRKRLPHTLKALNGLKGSRKSCPIPMLEGSQEGRGDRGCHGHNKSTMEEIPRTTQEKAAHIWKPCRCQWWTPQRSVRCADVLWFLKGAMLRVSLCFDNWTCCWGALGTNVDCQGYREPSRDIRANILILVGNAKCSKD